MKISEKYLIEITKDPSVRNDRRNINRRMTHLSSIEKIKLYGEIVKKETIQLFWKENTPEYKLLETELNKIAKENDLNHEKEYDGSGGCY